ncbi:unnamed protein product [Toxocara canis]|uniref:CUB domain-containing protein n=1 Tax=Toxocara canis TaxID=6265 RepID=A0A183UR44_TOXCA|nr:unnamed protein product [Toxocara canis]
MKCQLRITSSAAADTNADSAVIGDARKRTRCLSGWHSGRKMRHKSPGRLLLSTCITLINAAITYSQDCSRIPILLTAQEQPRFFHTEGYENGQYPSNVDCNWILMAQSAHRRILLTVHDSHIDDALFSRCDDFCSVRDGKPARKIALLENTYIYVFLSTYVTSLCFSRNTNTSSEIVRWCGEMSPFNVISSSDALYVTFHSDDSFQARGVNMSFSDFEVPGCPSTWESVNGGEYCYSLRMQRMTWADAQKDCVLARSNLATFESSHEYTAFAGIYSKNKSFPWTGYSDTAEEGVFVPADPSENRWPEDFPNFGGEHPLQDCVYFDWNVKEGPAYALDDCRNKHEYVCKRKADGSTIPYPPPADTVRRGLAAAPFNFTVWLFILVVLLLLLLILYLCYYKCKEKRANSRVGSMDVNQRLVVGVDAPPTSTLPHFAASNDRAAALAPTTVENVGHAAEAPLRAGNIEANCKQFVSKEQAANVEHMRTNLLNTGREHAVGVMAHPLSTEKTMDTWAMSRDNTLPPLGTRETTMGSNPREEMLTRIRRGELFERPRVAVLDNVSAISLDQFWSNNEPAFNRR